MPRGFDKNKIERPHQIRDNVVACGKTPHHWRPTKRSECPKEGPCPYVGCRNHLFLEVRSDGSILYNFKTIEEMDYTCTLEVIQEFGTMTLSEIGEVLGITRERIRQLERTALSKMTHRLDKEMMNDLVMKEYK